MIGSLSGSVSYRNGDDIILDVNGVGYLLTLSQEALDICGPVGSSAKLIVYTDVRENAISLFGFSSIQEKQVFLLAKKVKGVGSKLALALLSTIGAEGLLISIGQQNVQALQSVPGVGRKTAERIIVELREQVGTFVQEVSETSGAELRPNSKVPQTRVGESSRLSGATLIQHDAALALEKLGVASEKARQAVSLALQSGKPFKDSGELVKLSLANL